MYVVVVEVKVKPGAESAARFEAAITANHVGTRTEAGNLRFDVLKLAASTDEGEPTQYLLYEVYRTKDDFAVHQQTAHYLTFREGVADLMAEPRRPQFYESLQPEPWT